GLRSLLPLRCDPARNPADRIRRLVDLRQIARWIPGHPAGGRASPGRAPCALMDSRSKLCRLAAFVFLTGCGPTPVHNAPSSRPPNPLFVDDAARAGIHFAHTNGADAHKFYYIESTPAGCAFIDYDDDGWMDVILI